MSQPEFMGRYQLGRELGRGFSSIVFEATDTRRGRPVALKVLTLLQTLTPGRRREMSERFEREARAISALSHPAIVAVYDVGHADDGREFLVMERLEGETLRARLERAGPMLRAEALPLMVQIADALQYAHGRGIIHRDVKPDNIFLCVDGTAKLMDFGVAHVFADDGLTQTGTVVGSPAYMSPEQINGDTLDGRSDVFSLAVTLVETLTGCKPFEGPNIPAVLNRILNQPPQMAGIGAPALQKALERALAKPAPARTPSAGAFAESLRRVLPAPDGSRSVTGTQIMLRPVLDQPTRRGTGAGPAWGVALLGVAALITLAFVTRHPAPAPPPPPAIVSLPVARPVPMVAFPPPPPVVQTQSPIPMAARARVAARPQSSALITENVPVPDSPPLTLGTLNALRDDTPPTPPPPAADTAGEPRSMPTAADEDDNSDGDGPAAPPPDVAPQLMQRAPPLLPPGVPPQALPASVGLLVSVNEHGDVSRARVTESSGNAGLDSAAIADVLTWQYAPASRAGRAVPADVTEQVGFSR